MDNWSPKFITWWGRIETIKMMVSPLVNYLINTLPLVLSEDFHHKLDILISKFIWQGKKARISLKKLRLDRTLGSVNLADFKSYQTAFLVKQGSYWFSTPINYVPVWLEVEKPILDNLNLLFINLQPYKTKQIQIYFQKHKNIFYK